LFTLPQLVDELFFICGKNPKDYFNYIKLEILCKYFFDDATVVSAYADKQKFADEMQVKCGEPAENIISFLKESKRVYEITEPVFLKKSLHKISTYLLGSTLQVIPKLPTLNMFESMASYNRHYFKTAYAAQLFNRYATYNGSNPYLAPATLNLIPHLEFNLDAYLPVDGMISITNSLCKLATDIGVRFKFNERVTAIQTNDNRVSGVQTESRNYTSDIVISNMDIYPTYHKLLPEKSKPHRILNQPRSGLALIFYWSVKKEFPELDVHNIFFSSDYQKEFEAVSKHQTVCDDPTIYVNITSKKIKTDAPKNCENWFVLINVPPNTGQD
jgi:phytoene dehydrogenase-like protein